ncbi:polyprenyl diphosphate synthase [Streptomyces sp. NPDC053560]|uniref:polyprenyl diphosphate synthase n=1 Tax=Streptomyces sp. NPDC053560 TaxID=3365711 RepID=UPI0037D60C35
MSTIAERAVARRTDVTRLPRHIGIIPDGNRTWARKQKKQKSDGYRPGLEKTFEVLEWCDEAGIEVVTFYTLSAGNLRRTTPEVELLLAHAGRMAQGLADMERWQIKLVGALDLLPTESRVLFKKAAQRTDACIGMTVNLAVGYTGRLEIVRAVQDFLRSPALRHQTDPTAIADMLTAESLGEQLATHGQPDPDLVIRTSGEQRLSGFLTWQADQAELYFCPRCWPAFRKVDFLRALRSYTTRQRRFGR